MLISLLYKCLYSDNKLHRIVIIWFCRYSLIYFKVSTVASLSPINTLSTLASCNNSIAAIYGFIPRCRSTVGNPSYIGNRLTKSPTTKALVCRPSFLISYFFETFPSKSSISMRIIIINQSNFIQIKFNFSVNWRQHLRPILVIFASTVVVTICVSSDITLLGVMENDYTVGIYTVVVKLYHIVQGVLAAILTVVIPRLAWLWGKKDA